MSKKDLDSLRLKLRRLYIQRERRDSGFKKQKLQVRIDNLIEQIKVAEAEISEESNTEA